MTTALMIIAAIVGLLFIVALLMGQEMNLERSVIVNKPVQQVFEYLKLVRNHENFSIWQMMDPGMKKEYHGTDGTVGFINRWDSITNKNVGAGEQEITRLVDGKEIEMEIRFQRPMQNVAKASFVLTALSPDQTKVLWGFYSKMKFPMNIMKPFFMKMLGRDLEKGLHNLKVLLEKQV